VILSLGASRLYGEPTRFRNLRDLRREWNELQQFIARAPRLAEATRAFGVRMVEETVPPDDERFTFHASWAIEAYTPLHANCLVEGLSALGYDAKDPCATEVSARA
jgi:hypothetical protein